MFILQLLCVRNYSAIGLPHSLKGKVGFVQSSPNTVLRATRGAGVCTCQGGVQGPEAGAGKPPHFHF